MRAAACELLAKFGLSGVDYVFIARKSTSEVRWEFLSEDMKSGIDSINKKMLKCEKSRYC
jgi:RNase P protein component